MGVVTATSGAIGARPATARAAPVFGAERLPWLLPWLLPGLLAAALGVALVVVGSRHEPWADEAQAWLLARDSSLFELLVERVRHEGSPGLWHLLLWLAGRAGLPFERLHLLPTGFAVAGAHLVLARAPFPRPVRIGIVLSYVFAYQYAVVARSYALDLVLVPLLAIAFVDRLARTLRYGLLIGLLANANAHGFVMAAVLGLEWTWAARQDSRLRVAQGRSRRCVAGLGLAALLGLAAAFQAWPPADNAFLEAAYPEAQPRLALLRFGQAFIERADLFGRDPPSADSLAWGFGLSLLALVPTLILFSRAGRLALFGALMAALLGFSVATYGNLWHSGFLFLAWLFCLWTSWDALAEAPRPLRAAVLAGIAAVLAASAAATLSSWRREIEEPYASGPAIARWLAAEPRGGPVAGLGFKLFAVQPWFARNVFANHRGGAAGPAYFDWRRGRDFPLAADPDRLDALLGEDRFPVVLVSTFGLEEGFEAELVATARRRGYCVAARFEAGLIWKGYVPERDDAFALTRCARPG